MEQGNNELIAPLNILCCPVCKGALVDGSDELKCTNCNKAYKRLGSVYCFLDEAATQDIQLSLDKWNAFYSQKDKMLGYEEQYQIYLNDNFANVFSQLCQFIDFSKKPIFLEIGSGPLYLGRALSDKCQLVVGVDFSLEALLLGEKMLKAHGVTNYMLILADVNNMPIKHDSIDLVYGGGVIEHFQDTKKCIVELYRVLKPNGVSFNTVPHLNIGSLTYRQVWGNIPNFPILKQLAEFIHIKLLKSKHMIFGYEFSFLISHLKIIHRQAGFKKVYADKFETKLLFEFVPIQVIKKVLIWLANNSPLFWPMIKIVGVK